MPAPKLYLYVRQDMPVPPAPFVEDEDVLDFEDIGGIYDSSGAASANTSIINNYFASAQSGYALRFGGARVSGLSNKRQPSTAFFSGTIVGPVPAGGSAQTPSVIIDGAGSLLEWTGGTLGNNPCISIDCNGSARVVRIHDLRIDSDGFGVYLNNIGENTTLSNMRISASAAGTISLDGWTDLATAGYGLALDGECDGGQLTDISCKDCGGHGILIKNRWHDGRADKIRTHNCGGSGFKGQRVQVCSIDGRFESNFAWGFHIRRCGIGVWDTSSLVGVTMNTPSVWDVWLENNNERGSTVLGGSSGYAVRQAYIQECGTQLIGGHTGWGSNKVRIDEGSRNSCMLIDSLHIVQSVAPVYDLNNDINPDFMMPHQTTNASNNNFATKWATNPGLKPTVVTTGNPANGDQGFRITFPAGCLDSTDGTNTAYWRPWGLQAPFTHAAGDTYIYEIELSSEGNPLFQWCVGREESSTQRQNSTIAIPQIAAIGAAKSSVGLYNVQRRKFSGTVKIATTPSVACTPEIIVWYNGSQNQSTFPQSSTLDLNIHSWKFYRIPA